VERRIVSLVGDHRTVVSERPGRVGNYPAANSEVIET
jgi:hypothetical protein